MIQPIFIGALAFLHELKNAAMGLSQSQPAAGREDGMSRPGDDFLASIDKQSLNTLVKALQRIEHFWAGCAYATGVLRKREGGKCMRKLTFLVSNLNGNLDSTGLGFYTVDSSAPSNPLAAITVPDGGLLRRYVVQDPKVKPATLTSLRASMAAESSIFSILAIFQIVRTEKGLLFRACADTFSLDDIWNSFAVNNASNYPGNYLDMSQVYDVNASGMEPAI